MPPWPRRFSQTGVFENGNFVSFAGFDFSRVDSPSAAIDGWTVTKGNVDWIGTYWQAADWREER